MLKHFIKMDFHKLLKLERENLALASKNGPRELKIKRLVKLEQE